ncbi:hypothetical protein ACGFNX_34760 [Streptomyces sp. NPDC048723]|uniref:hypothetical protein n=1 Tax=unclassified Streptomyces TaxID=2593676 RepID=UPI000A6C19F5
MSKLRFPCPRGLFAPLQAAESEVPLSRWSCPELAREAARLGIVPFVNLATRVMSQDPYASAAGDA